MGLNPGEDAAERVLRDQFNSGSPYFGMYHAGRYGVPLEDCIAKCRRNGIALRPKDIRAYEDGCFQRNTGISFKEAGITRQDLDYGKPLNDMKLTDYPLMPAGWIGTSRRFFPCTSENKPMCKWGWSRTFTPELYTQADAKALSPVGWVGQNMLYQPFIVMDIDGRGHGEDDAEVIAFGTQFRDMTMTMEDPAKPGSFHLYFKTRRLLPVRHFTWAKLDFMGNAGNYAVYLKNKKSNNLPMAELDEEIWQKMLRYQRERKETICL